MARYKDPDVMGNLPKDEWDACMLGDSDYTDSLASPERWERAKLAGFRGLAIKNTPPEALAGATVEEKEEYRAFLLKWKADHDNQD